jgi:glycerol-3-phosphate O-acyltransferase
VISADENGKLVFDPQLVAVAQDARVILSREIRHSILKLTPEKQAALSEAAKEDGKAG